VKKGFTLLELIVVIIILGILATLGFTQYTRMVERGRTAEARTILGQLRSSQTGYFNEYGVYGSAVSSLVVDAPTACVTTHFFMYASNTATSTATRCTDAGKTPNSTTDYSITLSQAGVFGGTSGYY
jgi:type IV pilus assembly protein PilE